MSQEAAKKWAALMRGEGCPFCAPREASNSHHEKVADLSVSTLYLLRNQTYRGYCALIFNPRHATGLETLSAAEFEAFSADLRRAAKAINAVVKPDLMNYATLGNVIPHMHYHIIPRYHADPRWGAPVWESDLSTMKVTGLPKAEFDALRDSIAAAL
jgi:diadenosine tetraphosphate (Ap4A) HIT family hydrolase